jgi:hypothetical protein
MLTLHLAPRMLRTELNDIGLSDKVRMRVRADACPASAGRNRTVRACASPVRSPSPGML